MCSGWNCGVTVLIRRVVVVVKDKTGWGGKFENLTRSIIYRRWYYSRQRMGDREGDGRRLRYSINQYNRTWARGGHACIDRSNWWWDFVWIKIGEKSGIIHRREGTKHVSEGEIDNRSITVIRGERKEVGQQVGAELSSIRSSRRKRLLHDRSTCRSSWAERRASGADRSMTSRSDCKEPPGYHCKNDVQLFHCSQLRLLRKQEW